MKKMILILTLIVAVFIYKEVKNNDIIIPDTAIRLRVIPNSNSTLDQNIKNKVKKYLENNTYNLIRIIPDHPKLALAKDELKNSNFATSKILFEDYFKTCDFLEKFAS